MNLQSVLGYIKYVEAMRQEAVKSYSRIKDDMIVHEEKWLKFSPRQNFVRIGKTREFE